MKRTGSILLLAALLATPLWGAADADYQDGMKAASTKDFATALGKLEAAVAAEPENVHYASDYRQVVIQAKEYERAIAFFDKLATAHPESSNAALNYGFAYVDKIPDAGSITQVILANNSLKWFTKSIEVKPTWLGLYTRGNSYLFWPKIFKKASLGVADLEAAMKMQKADTKMRTYYVRVYISLGDGYWKTDDIEKARAMWKEGLTHFPGNKFLEARLAREGDALKEYIDDSLDPNKRVDTNLNEIWLNQ